MVLKNRWVCAVAGVAVLLLAGLVYAWSVLSAPIAQEYPQWTKAELSLTFTIVMILFCVGCIVGGLLTGKVSPRVYVWTAAVLFLAGFLLAAGMTTLPQLYLGFGVICGFASGIAYNAVMGTVNKWFPDKQGLISGILLMGFGMSSFLVGKVYQACTPAAAGAWRQSFVVLGIITAVILAVCAFWIRRPPEAPVAKASGAAAEQEEVSTGRMFRRPAFCLYYVWASLLSAAGLALVSQASDIAYEVSPESSAATVATVVGVISIFNGIGRVAAGAIFDGAGRRRTMLLVNISFVLTGAVLLLALLTGSFVLLTAGFLLGGLSYGGVPSTNSAFVASYYGSRYYPLNFAVINTSLIPASFGSTIAGALYDTWQTYESTYLMIAALGVAGMLLSAAISLCDRREGRSR